MVFETKQFYFNLTYQKRYPQDHLADQHQLQISQTQGHRASDQIKHVQINGVAAVFSSLFLEGGGLIGVVQLPKMVIIETDPHK